MKRWIIALAFLLVPITARASCGTGTSLSTHLANVATTMVAGDWCLLNAMNGDSSNYGDAIFPIGQGGATTGTGYAIFQYAAKAAYDQERHRIFYAGGIHYAGIEGPPAKFVENYGFVGFDIFANHWHGLSLPGWVDEFISNPHPYGDINFIPALRTISTSKPNNVLQMVNADKDDITAIGGSDYSTFRSFNAGCACDGWSIYFPERNSIVMYQPTNGSAGETKLTEAAWHVVFQAWPITPTYRATGSGAAYSHVHHKILFGGGGDGAGTNFFHYFTIDENANVFQTADAPSTLVTNFNGGGQGGSLIWSDGVSGDFLVLAMNAARTGYIFYKYDVDLNSWVHLSSLESAIPIGLGGGGLDVDGMTPLPIPWYDLYQCIVVDAPDLGVTFFLGRNVWIYKHTANQRATGLTFDDKITLSGTVGAYGFKSAANVRDFPTPAAYPLHYQVTGSPCSGLFTNYPYDPTARTTGEANAKCNDINGVAYYPTVDSSVFNADDGLTTSLRIDIPSQSADGVGGYFDTPYQGTDVATKVNLSPSNFARVWLQMSIKGLHVTNANLYPSIADGGAVGPKIVINASVPPWIVGSDANGVIDTYIDITKNALFAGYTYPLWQYPETFDRTIGGTIYVQNSVLCPYAMGYTTPPCIKLNDGGPWQRLTWHGELRPACTDCSISGTTLTKTGIASSAHGLTWPGKWVYIESDDACVSEDPCVGNGYYTTVSSRTDDDHLVLTGSPPTGTKTVFISEYNNSVIEYWVDQTKIFSLTDQGINWDGTGGVPGGFGSFRIAPQMTRKDPTVVHTPASLWYSGMIVSTEPLALTGANGVTPCTPDHLAFTSQPGNALLGASLGTVSVAVKDSGNNVCGSDTSTVTLSKHSATCTGMTLNGTVSGAASGGVFTTSNLDMTVATGSCSLDAADGMLTGATSNSFTITNFSNSSGRLGLRKR